MGVVQSKRSSDKRKLECLDTTRQQLAEQLQQEQWEHSLTRALQERRD
jgi:hypothetical protein